MIMSYVGNPSLGFGARAQWVCSIWSTVRQISGNCLENQLDEKPIIFCFFRHSSSHLAFKFGLRSVFQLLKLGIYLIYSLFHLRKGFFGLHEHIKCFKSCFSSFIFPVSSVTFSSKDKSYLISILRSFFTRNSCKVNLERSSWLSFDSFLYFWCHC